MALSFFVLWVVLLGPPQVSTCDVGSRPVPAGARWVLRTLRVVGAFPGASGRSALGARLLGSPISPEKWGERGGKPLDPRVLIARLLPLARFGVVGRSGAVVGLFRGPSVCPDLGRFFRVGFHDPEASLGGSCHRR